jgi:ActR/RegA family two-component response regulator
MMTRYFVLCSLVRLEKRGFVVTVANNVEQALPLAKANPPEYAVVDLKMDGASGLVLTKAVARTRSCHPHCDADGVCQHSHCR